MAETLNVIFLSPWHYFGTLILIFVVGTMVNMWINTFFAGRLMRSTMGWLGRKKREQKPPK